MNKYVLTPYGKFYEVSPRDSSDELRHWKYTKRETLPNGKYRYYYEETSEDDSVFNRIDRYIEAGKTFVNTNMSTRVIDLISGKYKYLSWEDAKRNVDYKYRHGDPNKFLTDEYRSIKGGTSKWS